MVSKFKSYLFSICFFIICLFNFSVGYGYLYLDLKNEDYVIDSNRREYFVEINRNSGANNIRYFKISPSSSSPINVQLDDLSVKVRKSSTPPIHQIHNILM